MDEAKISCCLQRCEQDLDISCLLVANKNARRADK